MDLTAHSSSCPGGQACHISGNITSTYLHIKVGVSLCFTDSKYSRYGGPHSCERSPCPALFCKSDINSKVTAVSMCPNTSQKYIKCFRQWSPTLVQLMWQTISRIVYATQFETGTSVAYCNFLQRCRKLIQCTFQSEMHAILPCRKNKRRYLLTLQVSKYCLLTLQSRISV